MTLFLLSGYAINVIIFMYLLHRSSGDEGGIVFLIMGIVGWIPYSLLVLEIVALANEVNKRISKLLNRSK